MVDNMCVFLSVYFSGVVVVVELVYGIQVGGGAVKGIAEYTVHAWIFANSPSLGSYVAVNRRSRTRNGFPNLFF